MVYGLRGYYHALHWTEQRVPPLFDLDTHRQNHKTLPFVRTRGGMNLAFSKFYRPMCSIQNNSKDLISVQIFWIFSLGHEISFSNQLCCDGISKIWKRWFRGSRISMIPILFRPHDQKRRWHPSGWRTSNFQVTITIAFSPGTTSCLSHWSHIVPFSQWTPATTTSFLKQTELLTTKDNKNGMLRIAMLWNRYGRRESLGEAITNHL